MTSMATGVGGFPAWWQSESRQSAVPGATSGGAAAFGALVCFTVILLIAPQTWFPVLAALRIAFLAAAVAIGAHLMDRLVGRAGRLAFNPELWIALALVTWAVITIPVSYWPAGSVDVLSEHYLKAVTFFWLVTRLTTTLTRWRALAWTLVACAVPLALTGISNYMNGEVLTTGVPGLVRIAGYLGSSGLTGNPNDLALMLNLIIPIAAGLLMASRHRIAQCFAGLSLLVSGWAVIVTFSRAGFLTLGTTAVLMVAVLIRRRSRMAALVVILAALCAAPLLPAGYLDRLGTITNMSADRTGSAQGRWKDLSVAADVVASNPIFGVGIGQDVLALNEQRGAETWRSVHNAYLQYAVDLGLPGLTLFLWLYLSCFRRARAVERRARRHPGLRDLGALAAGTRISLVAFGVAAMFHPIAYQFYFFTIAGLAVALANISGAEAAPARAAEEDAV